MTRNTSTTAVAHPRGSRIALSPITLGTIVIVALLFLVAVFGPIVVPYDPERVAGPSYLPPSAEFWFGTDSAGLDVFSRTVAATQLNVLIGAGVALLATLLGVVFGLFLGVNEPAPGIWGAVSRQVSRLVDLLQAVPAILIGVVAVAFYGAEVPTLIVAISIILAPQQIRLVRTEVLRVRSEGYVESARVSGARSLEVGVRHILPNSLGPALRNMSVVFAIAIIVTAGLGFIGVGLAPPTAEWGSMLAGGATDALQGNWWAALFPAAALALSVSVVALLSNRLFRAVS